MRLHIYAFYNQCWHIQNVFYGHEANDQLGRSVAISGDNAVAGSPFADMNGLNESGRGNALSIDAIQRGESLFGRRHSTLLPMGQQLEIGLEMQ